MAHGDLCHIGLFTTDTEKTKEFYSSLFGWTFESIPGFETYAMFTTPAGLGGGFDAGPRAEPPSEKGPILHIEVEDIDQTLERIEEAGGRILAPKTKISDAFGFFAVFIDNVGNRLALWSG